MGGLLAAPVKLLEHGLLLLLELACQTAWYQVLPKAAQDTPGAEVAKPAGFRHGGAALLH